MPLVLNDLPAYGAALAPADAERLGAGAPAEVRRFLAACPRHVETPLHALTSLAVSLDLDRVFLKDEGRRLGLGSFKALGGAYAVMRIVHELAEASLGRSIAPGELTGAAVRTFTAGVTVACATDGNHGRSVAAGARLVGCRAAIFVHAGVSSERVEAIRAFGAEIIRVQGTYDDSVAEASRVARAHAWHVVSDTSWPGYEEVASRVMQGYTVLVDEALRQIQERGDEPPTHVLLQAGVGGFAAAVAGHLADRFGADRSRIIVVEPDRANCLFCSVARGARVRMPEGEPTVMAMLACYEPSLVAWRVLERCADAFLSIPDDLAIRAMRVLASPFGGDAPIVSGESGAAGLAGLLAVAGDRDLRRRLGLESGARVLLISTEGATDAASYERIVGVAPGRVAAA